MYERWRKGIHFNLYDSPGCVNGKGKRNICIEDKIDYNFNESEVKTSSTSLFSQDLSLYKSEGLPRLSPFIKGHCVKIESIIDVGKVPSGWKSETKIKKQKHLGKIWDTDISNIVQGTRPRKIKELIKKISEHWTKK